jgi:hypothetical protein
LPDGSTLIEATVQGHCVSLGDFTGKFLVMAPPSGPPIVVKATFQGKDRSTVLLTITLTDMTPDNTGTGQVLHGQFVITGGSSRFARSGGGTASVRVDASGASLSFVLKGEIARALSNPP